MEKWKDVKGYEGIYKISSKGRLKRLIGPLAKKERFLKVADNQSGYKFYTLCKNGKVKIMYAHRIVAMAFIPNPKNKEEVNHIDGDRSNNNLRNLEWVTRSENHHHRYKVLKQRGVNYGKTGALNWRSKKVLQLDMDGNLIREYPAVMEPMRS